MLAPVEVVSLLSKVLVGQLFLVQPCVALESLLQQVDVLKATEDTDEVEQRSFRQPAESDDDEWD